MAAKESGSLGLADSDRWGYVTLKFDIVGIFKKIVASSILSSKVAICEDSCVSIHQVDVDVNILKKINPEFLVHCT